MKQIKFLAICAVLFTVCLSSCTNDEIPVAQTTTFRINPSTVVQPFTYEIKSGELESIPSGYELRVRLLVYNSEGVLAKSETQYLTNYASYMSTSMDLDFGSYTAVVITDCVRRSGDEIDFALWELSDERSISTAKITDLGYIGYQAKILGFGSKKFSVAGSSKDITINPSPAGTLFLIMHRNIHTYSDVEYIELETNRSSDYLTLNESGKYDVAIKNNANKFNWRVNNLEPADYPNSTNIYSYVFLFPMNNVSFRFAIGLESGEEIDLGEMLFNLTASSQYYFELDLCNPDADNGITYEGYLIDDKTQRSSVRDLLTGGMRATPINNDSFRISTLVQ